MQLIHNVKKLVSVLATSMSVTDGNKKAVVCIPYIHYLV